MEAEILAATSLLVEAIYVKQVLQFLVGDNGGLGNQESVKMQLRLDSTSAHAFFSRLGPGKAKHLSTRLLWTQSAMRKQWFYISRISTKENPADLNTKALSKESREYLMKRIGLQSSNFDMEENTPYYGKKKQLVKLLVNMIMASNLQGCEHGDGQELHFSSWRLTLAMVVIFLLLALVMKLFFKLTAKMEELEKYKAVWKTVREAAHVQRDQDPLCSDLHAKRLHAGDEEEEDANNMEDDETVSESAMDGNTHTTLHLEEGERDGETILRRLRVIRQDAEHGATDDGADVPDRDEGGDGHHRGDRPSDEDESFEVERIPQIKIPEVSSVNY
jgi:ABC-type multidrug transport system fused ATPase/permease subunit